MNLSILMQLTKQLDTYSDQYYNKHSPSISDREFDRLVEEHNVLADTLGASHYRFGRDNDSFFETLPHTYPMLSLENSYNEQDVIKFITRISSSKGWEIVQEHGIEVIDVPIYTLQPKIDGLSISLEYFEGKLVKALTRGDGDSGDNVINNVLAMGIPKTLKKSVTMVVRGEIYISEEDFTRINQTSEFVYANPRNLASGTLKSHDPEQCKSRNLQLMIFDVLGNPAVNLSKARRWLGQKRVYSTPPMTGEEVLMMMKGISKEAVLPKLNPEGVPTDGIVIKLCNPGMKKTLGDNGRAPRWAVAYKFEEEVETSIAIGIRLQPGRTGVLTPVVDMEPVRLAGTTVSKATCHNLSELKRLRVYPGVTLYVKKGGEIIPVIVDTDGTVEGYEKNLPVLKCPMCESVGEVVGVHLMCTNRHCRGQLLKAISYMFSKHCFNLKGLGPSIISSLVSTGKVHHPLDIFHCDVSFMVNQAGLGNVESQKIYEGITKILANTDALTVFVALGIPHVGPAMAKKLLNHFGSIGASLGHTASVYKQLDGVCDMAFQLEHQLSNRQVGNLMERLTELGLPTAYLKQNLDALPRVVITGKFKNFTREELSDVLYKHGVIVVPTVNKNTSLLVHPLGSSTSTKTKQAERLGVQTCGIDADLEDALSAILPVLYP